jgi:hypothetical protein
MKHPLCLLAILCLPLAVKAQDGAHDFDFADGTWHTHITRVLDPLNEKSARIELDGTVVTNPIWNGRGRIEQVAVDGADIHWEGMGVYTYNPKSRQWSEYFANSTAGTIGTPFIGSFKNGRGELTTTDTLDGRAVLVRALWLDIKPDSHTYEEDFSDDGGKSWKLSFIAKKDRLKTAYDRK